MSFPLDAVAFWIAHPHLYAEAFNIAIIRAAQSHVRWVVQEPLLMLWHTYLPSGDAAHPRMSPLMHDAAGGTVSWPHRALFGEHANTCKLMFGAALTHSKCDSSVLASSSFLYMNWVKHDSNVIGLCPNQCRENRRTWNKSRHCIFNTPL